MRRTLILATLSSPFLLLTACHHEGTDSHTEVFKTPQEVAAARQATLVASHKELAVSVLRFARPDVEARPAAGASITVAADGVTQPIDLAPIEPELDRRSSEERSIVRKYLEAQLRPFDVERLKSLGFERVRPMAAFELVNTRGLGELQKAAGESPLRSVMVVTNLHRVTVVRRPEPAAVTVPVTEALTDAWEVAAAEVDAAAMRNLRDALAGAGENLFETIDYGPAAGRSGLLKPGVDTAVILLPEFLTAVRAIWKTSDNLVLYVPAPTGVAFVEQHNQRLLDTLAPKWKVSIALAPDTLCDQLLLRDDERLSLFAYVPATAATKPVPKPVTKPASKPYIVH